jgi:hypothetical protein
MKKKKGEKEFVVRESPEKYISDEEILTIIEKRLPELIKKKPSLRAKLRDMLSDVFVPRDDIGKILEELRLQRESSDRRFEEINRRFEEINKRFEAIDKRFEAIDKRFEAMDKRFEVIEKRLEEQGEAIKEHSRCIMELQKAVMELQRAVAGLQYAVVQLQKTTSDLETSFGGLKRTVSAVGRRWGVMAEDAFRKAFIEIVEKKLDIKEIKKWRVYDEEGIVYNEPCWVEVDIAIKNEKHILIEIKSSPSQGDIAAFFRLGLLYEKKEGVKPHLSMLAVFIEEKDREFAKKLGIEIFTSEE